MDISKSFNEVIQSFELVKNMLPYTEISDLQYAANTYSNRIVDIVSELYVVKDKSTTEEICNLCNCRIEKLEEINLMYAMELDNRISAVA